jgi:Holliday junction DNA helicase RuvB
VANRLLQRLRDFAHFSHVNRISSDLAKNGLSQMGVDDHGLTDGDRLLLKLLAEKFAGGPVGLSTLAAAMSEEKETIEDIREPFLLQLGFLLRTPKGRMLSQEAYEFLGISPKNTEKTSLF